MSIQSNNSISVQDENNTDDTPSSDNEGDINLLDDVDDNNDSTTGEDLEAIPKELRTGLDEDYWAHVGLLIDDTRPDLAINLDRFYWNNDNQTGNDASIVLSAITQYRKIRKKIKH